MLYVISIVLSRHFFPSNVLTHMDKDDREHLQNGEDFNSIIEVSFSFIFLAISYFVSQAFGQSFLQSDISIFRQNLQALETLNNKHKLFSKVSKRSMKTQLNISLYLSLGAVQDYHVAAIFTSPSSCAGEQIAESSRRRDMLVHIQHGVHQLQELSHGVAACISGQHGGTFGATATVSY